MALLWARKRLDVLLDCYGTDHPECSELSEIVKKLEKTVESNTAIEESVVKSFDVPEEQTECVVM
jgi:hypothetical protein